MTNSNAQALDLLAIAHQTMIDAGFVPDQPQPVLDELKAIASRTQSTLTDNSTRDLRAVLWSSIDDRKSRDLDQVEHAESLPNGDVRLRVGIADVDALVHKDSKIDAHAAENATSVYTGVKTFPMLPEKLSTDMTSLVGNADRPSITMPNSRTKRLEIGSIQRVKYQRPLPARREWKRRSDCNWKPQRDSAS